MRRLALLMLAGCALLAAGLFLQGCGDDDPTGPLNTSPDITSLTADPDTVDPAGASTLACTATDEDGDSLTYAWDPEAGTISGTGNDVTWSAPASPGDYSIVVTVTDEAGSAASDTVYVTVRGGTLLVQNDRDLLAVDFNGNYFTLYSEMDEVEVLGSRIFTGRGSMTEIDHSGNPFYLFSRPAGVPWATTTIVLPDAGFAFISNSTDSIYFVTAAGVFDRAIEIPYPSPEGLQATAGTVVGNNLVMVDTKTSKIWQVDLGTDQVSMLVDLARGDDDLRDVDYDAGAYYACESFAIHKYVPEAGETLLATLPGTNNTALCVVGRYLYVGGYSRDKVYRVDIETGAYEVFLEGMASVEDMEFIPVTLTP